jgi:hypothetical protein
MMLMMVAPMLMMLMMVAPVLMMLMMAAVLMMLMMAAVLMMLMMVAMLMMLMMMVMIVVMIVMMVMTMVMIVVMVMVMVVMMLMMMVMIVVMIVVMMMVMMMLMMMVMIVVFVVVLIMMMMMPLVVMAMVAMVAMMTMVALAMVALAMVPMPVGARELRESGVSERDGRYGEKALEKISTILRVLHVLAPSRLFAMILSCFALGIVEGSRELPHGRARLFAESVRQGWNSVSIGGRRARRQSSSDSEDWCRRSNPPRPIKRGAQRAAPMSALPRSELWNPSLRLTNAANINLKVAKMFRR